MDLMLPTTCGCLGAFGPRSESCLENNSLLVRVESQVGPIFWECDMCVRKGRGVASPTGTALRLVVGCPRKHHAGLTLE